MGDAILFEFWYAFPFILIPLFAMIFFTRCPNLFVVLFYNLCIIIEIIYFSFMVFYAISCNDFQSFNFCNFKVTTLNHNETNDNVIFKLISIIYIIFILLNVWILRRVCG